MGAKIISVGEDIRLEPAVDGWALDNERIEAYPRIGDFIALAAITDIPTLRALWLDLYPNIAEGEIFDLPGGLCLVEDGAVLVEPQCCADFSDMGRWRTLTDFKDPEWSQPYFSNGWIRLWFGHPRLAARRDGGNVWLAPDNDTDKFPVLPREGADIVSVPAAALRRALDAAMRVMTAVEARLDQALTGVLPDHLRAPAIDLMLNGYNGRYDELRERDQKQA
jgi:hypothetical protein